MSENLLQKVEESLLPQLEEKIMTVLTQLEELHKRNERLQDENANLRQEISSLQAKNEVDKQKLKSILSMIEDTVSSHSVSPISIVVQTALAG